MTLTTAPAAAPATPPCTEPSIAPAPVTSLLRPQALREGLRSSLAEQVKIALSLDVSPAQRKQIEALSKQGEEAADRVASADAETLDRVFAEASKRCDLVDSLSKVLTAEQMRAFAGQWLARHAGDKDPIHEAMTTILAAGRKLQLSEVQQTQYARVVAQTWTAAQTVRRRQLTGQLTEQEARAAARRLAGEMVTQLQEILTASQYQQLETSIVGGPATAPAAP